MNDSSLHPLARDYLKRLKNAAASLPRARRKELLGEIEAHLREALPAGASEAEALNVLERLGEPEQIVAEAEPGLEQVRAGAHEWLAIPLLLAGGFFFLVGWFIGLSLLWSSRVWTLRDKLIGTFVFPGGLLPIVFVLTFALSSSGSSVVQECVSTKTGSKCHDVAGSSSGGSHFWGIALFVVLLALPICTSIYLTWRANRRSALAQ